MAKEIHIVFQVLNFLHSDHHLAMITTPAEHLLLINLASHKGIKGICPSLSLIAKELKLTKMTVIRSIERWEELEIIHRRKEAGKRNYYFLSIPSPASNIRDTSQAGNIEDSSNIHDTGLVTFTSSTSNIHDDIDITKEELSNNKEKLLNTKSVDNSKRHPFADSMNAMANENRHIRDHEERKEMEKYSPMPDELRNMIKYLGKS